MATKPVNVDLDFGGVAKIIGLQNGVSPQDAATVAQLNAAIEGISWKDSTRVATQANLNLASPGATIDGITMVANDRVLVRANTSQPENGIYIWNGAAVAMTRALDASTSAELEQAVTTAEEGTSAGATFRQTSVNFVLDTGNVVWTSFGTAVGAASESSAGTIEIATQAETDAGVDDARAITPLKLATYSGRAKRFAASFGDGSATSYVITHNLGTIDVHTTVKETGGSKRTVATEVRETSTNSITILVNSAPTANALRAVVTA